MIKRNWSKAFISLIRRNTNWRCGKLQRQIVSFLRKTSKPVSMSELIMKFGSMTKKGKFGLYRVLDSLAKRHIIQIDWN